MHFENSLYYIKKVVLFTPFGIGAYLAPLTPVCITILFFILVDTVMGIWASVKREDAITLSRMKDIIPKLIIYLLLLLLSHVFDDQILSADDYIITRGMAFILVTIEFKSIVEKAEEITGKELWGKIKELLSSKSKTKKD